MASHDLYTAFNLSLDLMKSNYRKIPSTKNKAKLVTQEFLEAHINVVLSYFSSTEPSKIFFIETEVDIGYPVP